METNRHHPLLDEDFATEKTRKSYNLYVYAARIVATGRINENEQKALEDVMEKAKQAVTASSFGQKKKKSIEEKICEYKEASLALRNELVDEEIRVAKLRSGLETSQMSLNMIHVNIEKLQTLCRSLSIEANAVSMDNQRLEAVADKERIHWDKANSKLTLLTNRLHNLCMESPRMKDQQEKVRIVVDLQKRVLELEEETERLKMLCNVYNERNASAENVDFVRYVDVHATSIVRLFTNIGKLQNLQNEVDEIRLVTAGDDIRDPLEMSLAELDDTAYLLQYAQKSSAGVHSDESLEVVPPQNEVSAAKDSVVRKYVEEQSPVHQSQESSAMVPSVEDPNEANLPTSGSFQQKQPYPTVEDPVNYIPSVAITQPYANESAPHIVSYPEMANRLVETDVESVLNMTKNSEDPGSEFLQLMEADKAVGPFGDEPFGVAAGGDTVFDFAEFADMNFGVSMDVGDTPQFNLESSQNLDMGFPSADVTGDGADFFGLFNSSSN